MLPAGIDEIRSDDVAALVTQKVAERKVLEYKERLPETTDEPKKEFLADVCSFANSSGGDIVYGIRDERDSSGRPTGVPESITGLEGLNLSAERERLENMIRDGIKPRIPSVQTREIEIQGRGSVILLRVGRSWIRPHMVSYKGTSRFYSRHSTGKYQLDVQEIGQLFAEQRSLGEQLRSWRTERIARILSDEGTVRLDGLSKLLIHFVPAFALTGPQQAGPWPPSGDIENLLEPTNRASHRASRYNADGWLVYSLNGAGGCASYVQLFRNGCLEYGDAYILNVGNERGRKGDIPSKAFEEMLVKTFGKALVALDQLGIEDPVYFSCALVGVQDSRLSRDGLAFYGDEIQHKFDRQIIQTPEVQVNRQDSAPYRASLLPVVDSIWQANGYEGTPWMRNWGLDGNRRPLSGE